MEKHWGLESSLSGRNSFIGAALAAPSHPSQGPRACRRLAVWRAVGWWVAAAKGKLLCSEAAEAIFFTKSSATELMQMQQQQHRQLAGNQHSFNYNPALLRVGLSKATVTLPVRTVTARLGSHQGICILHFSASVLLSPRGPLWLPGCVPKREVHAWRVATPGPRCRESGPVVLGGGSGTPKCRAVGRLRQRLGLILGMQWLMLTKVNPFLPWLVFLQVYFLKVPFSVRSFKPSPCFSAGVAGHAEAGLDGLRWHAQSG